MNASSIDTSWSRSNSSTTRPPLPILEGGGGSRPFSSPRLRAFGGLVDGGGRLERAMFQRSGHPPLLRTLSQSSPSLLRCAPLRTPSKLRRFASESAGSRTARMTTMSVTIVVSLVRRMISFDLSSFCCTVYGYPCFVRYSFFFKGNLRTKKPFESAHNLKEVCCLPPRGKQTKAFW